MSIGLATIVALLLLLPGVGFIAGVNVADKNVREIIFRNTPAEIGYVILISVVVHLLLSVFVHFNVAQLYVSYENLQAVTGPVSLEKALIALRISLSYFLITSLIGSAVGYLMGREVSKGGRWRFFAKHRWMLDLTGMDKGDTLYARVVLNQKYAIDKETGDYFVVIEGFLRDTYFAADGTLLYLVFTSFTELRVPISTPPYIGTLIQAGQRNDSGQIDQLVVEGRQIGMARYRRLPLGMATEHLDQLEAAVSEG